MRSTPKQRSPLRAANDLIECDCGARHRRASAISICPGCGCVVCVQCRVEIDHDVALCAECAEASDAANHP